MPEAFQSKTIRVVIADDHALVREGFRRCLEFAGFKVVGEAKDGKEAVALVLKLNPDILLLDLNMPESSGFKALEQLQECAAESDTRAIVVTAEAGTPEIAKTLALGACGLVLKASGIDVLIASIRTVLEGGYWVVRQAVPDLRGFLQSQLKQEEPGPRPKNFGLTRRELQIVSGVVSGRSNKAIGQYFKIAIDTVKNHLRSIFDKTGVSNRAELVVFALKHNLPLEELD